MRARTVAGLSQKERPPALMLRRLPFLPSFAGSGGSEGPGGPSFVSCFHLSSRILRSRFRLRMPSPTPGLSKDGIQEYFVYSARAWHDLEGCPACPPSTFAATFPCVPASIWTRFLISSRSATRMSPPLPP